MIKGRLRDMNLTQREDVCFSHGGERNSSTAAVGQRKFGGGASSAVAQVRRWRKFGGGASNAIERQQQQQRGPDERDRE